MKKLLYPLVAALCLIILCACAAHGSDPGSTVNHGYPGEQAVFSSSGEMSTPGSLPTAAEITTEIPLTESEPVKASEPATTATPVTETEPVTLTEPVTSTEPATPTEPVTTTEPVTPTGTGSDAGTSLPGTSTAPETSAATTKPETSVVTTKPVTSVVTTKPVTSAPPDITRPIPQPTAPFTIAVTGDISFADNYLIMKNAVSKGYGVEDLFGEKLLSRMREADFLVINNEFCYSDRGSPIPGKAFTFRAATKNAGLLHEIGADLANLANNHTYDFGDDAFLDTLDTLASEGIPYVGAGHNESEAYAPHYFEINGVRIAFLAANRAEKSHLQKRVATGDNPGMAGIFNSARFVKEIKTARENADYVIVYAHWGAEYTETLQSTQKDLAREFIDAGADIVLGAHPHILQGAEFYRGRPIIYSLGNYLFNGKTLDTTLLCLDFDENGFSVRYVPAIQKNYVTREIEDPAEIDRFFRHIEKMSVNVRIDENGIVTVK